MNYLAGLFTGDIGYSLVVKSGEPVYGIIAERFPVSLQLA